MTNEEVNEQIDALVADDDSCQIIGEVYGPKEITVFQEKEQTYVEHVDLMTGVVHFLKAVPPPNSKFLQSAAITLFHFNRTRRGFQGR